MAARDHGPGRPSRARLSLDSPMPRQKNSPPHDPPAMAAISRRILAKPSAEWRSFSGHSVIWELATKRAGPCRWSRRALPGWALYRATVHSGVLRSSFRPRPHLERSEWCTRPALQAAEPRIEVEQVHARPVLGQPCAMVQTDAVPAGDALPISVCRGCKSAKAIG